MIKKGENEHRKRSAEAKIQTLLFDKQSCNETLKSSGVSTSLLFQQANSNWRCRPARPMTEPRHISYDDLPDLADIDPTLLACFGTLDSDASIAGTFASLSSYVEGARLGTSSTSDSSDIQPQCMSGFLFERSRSLDICIPLQRWTERWFVVADHPSNNVLAVDGRHRTDQGRTAFIISTPGGAHVASFPRSKERRPDRTG